jgi:hypothetical protein
MTEDIWAALGQGRARWLLWQALEAFDGDAEECLRWCERYEGTSEALTLMLREAVRRKHNHQFLPRRHRSTRHG